MKFFVLFVLLFTTSLLFSQTCESAGTVVVFSNYDGGYLNINVNQNIPNLKIGITSYEPTEVNIYGDFAGNVSEVHYAGYFPLTGTGNFHCDASLATASINAPAGALTTIVSIPTPTLLTELDPDLGEFGITIGNNNSIIGCYSCNNETYQGGANTSEQIGDYFVTYFGADLLFLKTQYPCWCGEYNLDIPPSCCFEVPTGVGGATILITGPSTLCPGETAVLTASGGYDSYFWSTGETGNPIVVSTPGVYTVTGTNDCGQGFGEIEILEDCPPDMEDCTNGIDDDGDGDIDLFDDDCPCELWSDLDVAVSNTFLLCNNDSDATIMAIPENGLAPYSYNWTDENALLVGTTMNVENLPAGNYFLQLTDGYGCTTEAQLSIDQPESLTLATTISPLLCASDSLGTIEVNANGGTPPYLFALDNAPLSIQNSFTDLSAGSYQMEVEDANGCATQTQLNIDQPEALTLTAMISSIPCADSSSLGAIEANASGGTPPYLFALDGAPLSMQSSFTDLSPGSYQLEVEDANGCRQLTTDLEIIAPAEFTLILGEEQTICLGEFITLKPEVFPVNDNLSFFWTSSTVLPCDTCQQLFLQPTATATYQLTVNDPNGCSATTSLVVNVTESRNLYIPNVFSPNEDGINDVFQIFPGKSVATLAKLQIYDRWGGLVFEGEPQQGWDGKVGRQEAPNGVYLYVLQLSYLDGVEEIRSGDVVLVR